MKKINLKLFISIISIYFLFVNFGFSETYSCSYKWEDEIRTSIIKRTGTSSFKSVYDDGFEAEYPEVIETKDTIILIDNLGTVFMEVIWKDKKRFSMVGLDPDPNKTTSIIDGNCRIIK